MDDESGDDGKVFNWLAVFAVMFVVQKRSVVG